MESIVSNAQSMIRESFKTTHGHILSWINGTTSNEYGLSALQSARYLGEELCRIPSMYRLLLLFLLMIITILLCVMRKEADVIRGKFCEGLLEQRIGDRARKLGQPTSKQGFSDDCDLNKPLDDERPSRTFQLRCTWRM